MMHIYTIQDICRCLATALKRLNFPDSNESGQDVYKRLLYIMSVQKGSSLFGRCKDSYYFAILQSIIIVFALSSLQIKSIFPPLPLR